MSGWKLKVSTVGSSVFSQAVRFLKHMVQGKGYLSTFPDMHVPTKMRHGEVYSLNIECSEDGKREIPLNLSFIGTDVREPDPAWKLRLYFQEHMLQPGYMLWIEEDTFNMWSNYFIKTRFNVTDSKGNIVIGTTLLDVRRDYSK